MSFLYKKSDINYYLTNEAERSFLFISKKDVQTCTSINELKSVVSDFFVSKGFTKPEVESHIFSIEEDNTKEKLKNVIKRFENNLINKPSIGLLNIGIINFDYLSRTPNEFHRILKLLEEPPKSTQIYIVSKEGKNIPKTISSRLITIKYFERNNVTSDSPDSVSIDFTESLNDTSKKINSLSAVELEKFLNQSIRLGALKDMNFNQINYIQKLINKASKYQKINLRPLDSELGVLRKLIREI